MNPHHNKAGFTFLELSIAIVATGILALTVGIMFQSMFRSIQRQSAMANLQSDMRVAVPALYRLARNASYASVILPAGAAGAGTEFRVGSESIYRANNALVRDSSGKNLVYQGVGKQMVLSWGWVNTFQVTNFTTNISFRIILNNTNDVMQVDGKALFRN